MTAMLIAHALEGHTVLIVHEDRFQGAYLGGVLAAAGATVAGPVRTEAAGIALVAGGEQLSAMVVSHEAGNREDRSLIDVAHQWGIVALVVHSSRVSPGSGSPTERSLAAPYAGYQVVDELADLLAAKRLADHAAAASASIGL